MAEEMNWEARYEQREAEKRANARLIVSAKPQVLEFFDSLIAAEDANKAVAKAYEKSLQAYTNALAEAAGVKIGSRVTRKRDMGYGQKRRKVEQTFVVTNISLYGYLHLSLRGKTILRFGGEGTFHDIGTDWELVPEPTVTE
jgi:hypothetical protein